MLVTAINSSPRANGNTGILLQKVLDQISEHGISTRLISLAGSDLKGCRACGGCSKNKNGLCMIIDDRVNELIQQMRESDGIILGSPVYYSDINSQMKALIDRAGYVSRANGGMFRKKTGAAVAAVRRAGAMHALSSMHHFFLINEMIIPGSSYWNLGIGRGEGEVHADEEGMKTMETLGQNFAWLLEKIHG